jgi:hypothetical protein
MCVGDEAEFKSWWGSGSKGSCGEMLGVWSPNNSHSSVLCDFEIDRLLPDTDFPLPTIAAEASREHQQDSAQHLDHRDRQTSLQVLLFALHKPPPNAQWTEAECEARGLCQGLSPDAGEVASLPQAPGSSLKLGVW